MSGDTPGKVRGVGPFDKVLVANRGEIARRILRTCRELGYATVAVFSDADRDAPFVREADEAVRLGAAPAAESYLSIERLLDAARQTRAGAIHPGYGFLAENAAFARACEDAGIVFVGPTSETIAKMGSKREARQAVMELGVPVIPGGDGADQSDEGLRAAAEAIGYPVLLKASAGGGGKGMRVVRTGDAFDDALAAARREAAGAFGDDTMLVERYIERPRHIEVQILGDAHGRVVHLFERECSIQRRHQKIIEETPSVALSPSLREAMCEAAVRVGQALAYRSAGTVEMILAPDDAFYFLEVNTRLQVEHPVTEMTCGVDLVALQLRVAAGEALPLQQDRVQPRGHALECRIYAEDPARGFLPATGRIVDWHLPAREGLRVDSGVETGAEVGVDYDPMLAKVVTWAPTREAATRRMRRVLEEASILGLTTNRDFLLRVLAHPAWARGALHTHFIDEHLSGEPPAQAPFELARIAAAATLAEAPADNPLIPSLPASWRNNRWRDPEWTWDVAGTTVEVRCRSLGAGRFLLTIDGEPLEARIVQQDGVTLRMDLAGHAQSYRVVPAADAVWVHGGGRGNRLARVDRFPEAEDTVSEGSCRAPMPGRILRVLVGVGDDVEAGAPLVILEAMKMEHTLTAPAAAKVAEVLAAEGDQVDADAPLVVLA